MRQIPHLFKSVLLVCGLAFVVGEADAGSPCCEVTSVNQKSGLVKAKALDGSRTFQFTEKDKSALSQLRVGQPVYGDFDTHKVSIDGAEPCCNMKAVKSLHVKAPKAQKKDGAKGTGKPGYDRKKDKKV